MRWTGTGTILQANKGNLGITSQILFAINLARILRIAVRLLDVRNVDKHLGGDNRNVIKCCTILA